MRDRLLLVIIAMLCFIKADLAEKEELSSMWYAVGGVLVLISLVFNLKKNS